VGLFNEEDVINGMKECDFAKGVGPDEFESKYDEEVRASAVTFLLKALNTNKIQSL
jgi:hypothetical protein